MTHISVFGATGKVGREVCALLMETDHATLAEAISASGTDTTLTLAEADFTGTDVVIDFSTPDAVMTLLDHLQGTSLPVIIGTTGFSAAQTARLHAEADHRALLIGANFTKGFEAFAATALALSKALPEAAITVGEVYKADKKMAASGTTKRLSAELSEITGKEIDLDIQRIGDTAGITTVVLDYKIATLRLELNVRTRAAYAAGAVEAALWLVGRANGLYAPKDLLAS